MRPRVRQAVSVGRAATEEPALGSRLRGHTRDRRTEGPNNRTGEPLAQSRKRASPASACFTGCPRELSAGPEAREWAAGLRRTASAFDEWSTCRLRITSLRKGE